MLWFYIVWEFLCFVWSASSSDSSLSPSKGGVWPKPQEMKRKDTFFTYYPKKFKFNVTENKCLILDKAVGRYKYSLWRLHLIVENELKNRKARNNSETKFMARSSSGGSAERSLHQGVIQQLEIKLLQVCDEYPFLGMVENYTLTVSENSVLTSSSIWGILRGLETFSQLFYVTDSFDEVRVNSTFIIDYPRYPHRGVMLDTSHHFIPVEDILLTLDAMAMNKLNVFHWRIVGDHSFPYQSEAFPELSEIGAFHYSMIYTKTDIEKIIDHATLRGIRIIPEIGLPGHTRFWTEAYPHILTKCVQIDGLNIKTSLGPVNPAREETYRIVGTLLREVQDSFPDKYMHFGGEIVDEHCWKSNVEIENFMRKNQMMHIKELYQFFLLKILVQLRKDRSIIFEQEVLDYDTPVPEDFPIQIWKDTWINDTVKILSSGRRWPVILSAPWSLDDPTNTFEKLYSIDPQRTLQSLLRAFGRNTKLLEKLLGGEAVILGDYDRNVISRVWPRASAVAEVLWSSPAQRHMTLNGRPLLVVRHYQARLAEHACRMLRRGVETEPLGGPGFCLL